MSDLHSIVVKNVSKSYKVSLSGSRYLKGLYSGRTQTVNAVKDVSFVAESGSAVGLLGRNGSGKSTLLRMVSGAESPSAGTVLVKSKPSLLGVSSALQPKLTGVENIRLGLLAMGVKSTDLENYVESVVATSSLKREALVRPMNTYSSGMRARLTFSIATALSPEILLIDEALGTGDSTFAKTARARMESMLQNSATVFVVSHSAATLRKTCRDAIWIHDGEIIAEGSLKDISREYAKWGRFTADNQVEKASEVIDWNRSNYIRPNIVLASEVDEYLGK